MHWIFIVTMSLIQVAASATEAPPTRSQTPRSKQSLSEKLDKNKGVIKPPSGVDPEMTQPAPATPNTMPVIPPRAPGAK